MEIDKKILYSITDENVITIGGLKPLRAKSIYSAIAVALKKAGAPRKGTTMVFFGDRDPVDGEAKISRHYHIAFTRTLSDKEKDSITQNILFNCECYEWGDPSKIVRWGCMYSISYLLNHGMPFVKTC